MNIPRNLKDAVRHIVKSMPDKDKVAMAAMQEADLIRLHHSLGTQIRNEFQLWHSNMELLEDVKEPHPDDAAMRIIEAVWRKLRELV